MIDFCLYSLGIWGFLRLLLIILGESTSCNECDGDGTIVHPDGMSASECQLCSNKD